MLKRLFMFALFVTVVSGCSNDGSSLEFRIDNPTDAPITLNIDGQDYAVSAQSDKPVHLSPGEHRLRSERLGDVRVIVYAKGRGGIINPTLSDYVLVMETYAVSEDKLKKFGPTTTRIDLGGVEFEGPFSKTHDLFIEKTWAFGVREPFPDTVTVMRTGNERDGTIKAKIFTAADFIRYIEDINNQPGAYLQRNPAGFVQPLYTLEPIPAQLPPLHEKYEAHAGAMRDFYARYLKATTADEQVQLQKESFQMFMDASKATIAIESSRDLPVEARKGYGQFMQALNHILSCSALVVPAP